MATTEVVQSESKPVDQQLPTIRLINLSRSFDHKPVLRNISLDFLPGKTTVVLGPSGCGKSVMLKHIIGLLKPEEGEVWFGDTQIDVLTESQLGKIRQRFGFLFQHGALFDSMSVRENVSFPLTEHTKLTRRQQEQRIRQVLEMVGLADTIDKMPAELSGGQQKRIALARSIVLEPQVVLYDEPTTGLDPIRANVINKLIIKLQHELNITSIVVTHDLGSAYQIADHIVMLHEGTVVMQGTPEDIRKSDHPVVQRFLQGTPPTLSPPHVPHNQNQPAE